MIHRLSIATTAAIAGLAAFAPASAASESQPSHATGVVFLDRNEDGDRQEGEPGIHEVLVSDGRNVVKTDRQGRWRLPAADDTHYFVIKPTGYKVPLNDLNMPRFSYAHKPSGSPDDDFAFKGFEPTGPLPDSIDFPLNFQQESDEFTIIAFGDPQPYSLEQIQHFRRDVIDPTLGRHDIAFGISVGDLVGDDLDLFKPLNEAQSLFGVPWYNVYGNHDMNFMSGRSGSTTDDPDRYADETFERVYGPPDYAFQYGDIHFIVLDDVIWQGFDGFREGDDPAWPDGRKPKTGNYRGGLRQHQLEFVENYLAHVPEDELVVLAFHIPIEMDGEGVHRIPEHRQLFEILSSHPHTFSMSGHTHFQRHWLFGEESGYTPEGENQHTTGTAGKTVHHHLNAVTASGSWYNGMRDELGMPHTQMRDGTPNGYTLVHFNENTYRTEFVPARRHPEGQMTISVGGAAGSELADIEQGDEAGVIVNVYNGSPADPVEMRIVPSPAVGSEPLEWQAMEFAPQVDPVYAATYEREQKLPGELRSNWGLPEPQVSHHIWEAALPSGLPAGTHVLEIKHTDLYGGETVNRRTIRVTED